MVTKPLAHEPWEDIFVQAPILLKLRLKACMFSAIFLGTRYDGRIKHNWKPRKRKRLYFYQSWSVRFYEASGWVWGVIRLINCNLLYSLDHTSLVADNSETLVTIGQSYCCHLSLGHQLSGSPSKEEVCVLIWVTHQFPRLLLQVPLTLELVLNSDFLC